MNLTIQFQIGCTVGMHVGVLIIYTIYSAYMFIDTQLAFCHSPVRSCAHLLHGADTALKFN